MRGSVQVQEGPWKAQHEWSGMHVTVRPSQQNLQHENTTELHKPPMQTTGRSLAAMLLPGQPAHTAQGPLPGSRACKTPQALHNATHPC